LFIVQVKLADTALMENKIIKNCAKCNLQLRIPTNIGGMLMRCPDCGYEFHTDFILSGKLAATAGNENDTCKQPRRSLQGNTFRIVV
jgi:hypothetical protein